MAKSESWNNEDCLQQSDRWYVFSTESHRELFAAQQLEKKSFQVYMPMILKSIRHARKTRNMRVPLFPGYGFIKFNDNIIPMHTVNTTYGVKYMITNNMLPAIIPSQVVLTLKSMTGKNDIVSFTPLFNIGDNVRFANGPFVNLVAELCNIDKKGRVEVLLSLLCGKVPVKIDVNNLLPA